MSTLELRLDGYTSRARRAVSAAQALADARDHAEVAPLHLLAAILDLDESVADAMSRAGVDPGDIHVEAELWLRKLARGRAGESYLSPRTLDLLQRVEREAKADRSEVTLARLFIGCAEEPGGAAREVFRQTGLSAALVRAALDARDVKRAAGTSTPAPSRSRSPSPVRGRARDGDVLSRYGVDLTAAAAAGELDPTIGRDEEIRRVVQVLARRLDNHPLLVGEPGIGKSAIVRALATRMAAGDVPGFLANRRLISLDTSALLSGAKLRGEIEKRIREVIEAVRATDGQTMLHIADLAPLLKGQAAGAGQLAAALEHAELRVIAVASTETHREAMAEHGSLLRRFVSIPIEAPSEEETVVVLRGLVGGFEASHGVRITDPALLAAARLARRYVPGVELPKSAVDLVDEAAAAVRIAMDGVPPELDRMERRLAAIEVQEKALADDTDDASVETRNALAAEREALTPEARAMRERWESELGVATERRDAIRALHAARVELERAHQSGDHARAGELRFGVIPGLEEKVGVSEEGGDEAIAETVHDTVGAEDVAQVIATWTGVPVAKMMQEESEKLLGMEDALRARVIGQDHALEALAKAVRRGRVGLRDPKRPIGSFLFVGPSGVGKTELAKAVAEFLFDDEAALTRLDMSEFMEKHMVARLLGSPPGYVDSESGGFLTEAVRNRPYSVLLFDEVEKAHPDVFDILLQVLDDGRLSDSRGRPAHFSDTVIIMTSNVGSRMILDEAEAAGDDEDAAKSRIREAIDGELAGFFRPEFLNRIDDVVIFDPLDREALLGIARIHLRKLSRLLEERSVSLEVDEPAQRWLVERAYEPAFGARPLRRMILKELQDPLAESLLRGTFEAGGTVRVTLEGDALRFEGTGA